MNSSWRASCQRCLRVDRRPRDSGSARPVGAPQIDVTDSDYRSVISERRQFFGQALRAIPPKQLEVSARFLRAQITMAIPTRHSSEGPPRRSWLRARSRSGGLDSLNTRRPDAGDQGDIEFEHRGSNLNHVKVGCGAGQAAGTVEGARRFPRRSRKEDLPFNIEGGTGSPIRAFAWLHNETTEGGGGDE
jgi:hypothetical protein